MKVRDGGKGQVPPFPTRGKPGPIMRFEDFAVAIDDVSGIEAAAAKFGANGIVGCRRVIDKIDDHWQLKIWFRVGFHPLRALGPLVHRGADGVGVGPAEISRLEPRCKRIFLGMSFAPIDPQEIYAIFVLLITGFQDLEVNIRRLSRRRTDDKYQRFVLGQGEHIHRIKVLVVADEELRGIADCCACVNSTGDQQGGE